MSTMRSLNFGPSLVDEEGNVVLPEIVAACEEGFQKGLEDAKQSLEAKIDTTLIDVREHLDQLVIDQKKAFEFLNWTVLEISKQISEKMIPYHLETESKQDVEAFVCEFLKNFSQKTKLTIYANTKLKERLETMISEDNFGTHDDLKISVEGDDDIEEGDCQLKWDDGGIDRIRGSIQSEIDRIFQCVLDNVPIGKIEVEPETIEEKPEEEKTEKQQTDEEQGETE